MRLVTKLELRSPRYFRAREEWKREEFSILLLNRIKGIILNKELPLEMLNLSTLSKVGKKEQILAFAATFLRF